MPFIPHTDQDVRAMLKAIGVDSIDALFDEIPPELRSARLEGLPPQLGEFEVARLMEARARRDGQPVCFAGAGAYDHHIPAVVWEIASRGEFYSAYTPYQAEASQGTLQLLYEYQTMMANLTALEVANASLYDGASALAEAVLMCVRLARKSGARRVLLPATVHPVYRRVAHTIVRHQGIHLTEVSYSASGGHIDPDDLRQFEAGEFVALVVPQPNFFGVLEEVDALTDWAHSQGLLVIGLVNPVALGLLSPPGEWGSAGADVACGEGQPLGVPLSSGGPYCGFMCCQQAHARQMPGRIAGRTVDRDGRTGYTLTLQAREQHIRRSKATSNICTNQGLMVTAAAIHMALLGPEGLARVAAQCHANTVTLVDRLTALPGVERVFSRPFFHEAVLRLPLPVAEAQRALAAHDLLAGFALGAHYPELGDSLTVCATEARTEEDLQTYAEHLRRILERRKVVPCPVAPKW
jgi:glycine dehydrogenase subunit 1